MCIFFHAKIIFDFGPVKVKFYNQKTYFLNQFQLQFQKKKKLRFQLLWLKSYNFFFCNVVILSTLQFSQFFALFNLKKQLFVDKSYIFGFGTSNCIYLCKKIEKIRGAEILNFLNLTKQLEDIQYKHFTFDECSISQTILNDNFSFIFHSIDQSNKESVFYPLVPDFCGFSSAFRGFCDHQSFAGGERDFQQIVHDILHRFVYLSCPGKCSKTQKTRCIEYHYHHNTNY